MNKTLLHSLYVIKITFIAALIILPVHAKDSIENPIVENSQLSFSKIIMKTKTIGEDDYFDFIRSSIIEQPEFLYANSNYTEKSESLKFAKRQRWPELSTRIINDQVLERDVSEQNSLRKRQDDSFDAAIELSQPIYSGGTINAQIRKSITDKNCEI